VAAAIAAAADSAPELKPGEGRLALGLLGRRDLLGAGLRLDHQLRRNVGLWALGEVGWSPSLEQYDWLAAAGLRLKW